MCSCHTTNTTHSHLTPTPLQMDHYLLAAMGDIDDVFMAVNASLRPHLNDSLDDLIRHTELRSHCTAMVRFTAAMDELYCAHNTWASYTSVGGVGGWEGKGGMTMMMIHVCIFSHTHSHLLDVANIQVLHLQQ